MIGRARPRGKNAWLAVLLATFTLVVATSAAAQTSPSPAEKATARALVKTGRSKLKKGEIDAALADFNAAHEIMGVPTTGVELGKAQVKAGMLVEALDTFLSVGRIPKARREPGAFRRAREEAKVLAKELGELVPAIRVMLSGTAAEGAEVTIDGKAVPEEVIGAAYKLNPGVHEIVARNGEAEARAQVELTEGEVTEATLVLDEPKKDDPTLPPPPPTETHPLVWAGLGLAGVGVIAGGITGALALDKHATVAQQCPNGICPPETFDDLNAGKTLGNVSTAMFAIGGVGAVLTVVGLFLPYGDEPGEEGELGTGLELRVGPASGSLLLRF